MNITAIKKQVKREGRYSVFIDGEYSFSFSEVGLINSGLKLGQEISDTQFKELKDTSKADKAYNQALGLIARRPRSSWEMEQYLTRKGYEKELQEQILNKLSEMRYLDDEAFARSWVESRRLLKSMSRRRLVQELKQKRISDDIIDVVLTADETDEREVLRKLVERKRKQSKYQDDLKLMQYLARQGYNYDDIKAVVKNSD